MKVKVELIKQDENNPLARRMVIRKGSKEVITPLRVISTKGKPQELMLKSEELKQIVEIHRNLTPKSINRILSSEKISSATYFISNALRRIGHNSITFLIVEYHADWKLPSEQEIECILDLVNNPYIDFAVILPKKIKVKDYITFMRNIANMLWFKYPILIPVIPHLSLNDISHIIDALFREDLVDTSVICVDFNGGNPISQEPKVSRVVRRIRIFEEERGEHTLLYALNLKYGKATKGEFVYPAQDILILVMGFDLYGPNHRAAPLGKNPEYRPVRRIFNRRDYGYYMLTLSRSSMSAILAYEIAEAEDIISIRRVVRQPELADMFNAEKQIKESMRISQEILEDNSLNYCLPRNTWQRTPAY